MFKEILTVKNKIIRFKFSDGKFMSTDEDMCEECKVSRHVYSLRLGGPITASQEVEDTGEYWYLKECTETCQVCGDVLKVFFSEDSVPTKWERTSVVPVHRNGNRATVLNFRPASLTSMTCKILQKMTEDFLTGTGCSSGRRHRYSKRKELA